MIWLFNLRTQSTETELTLPDRVVAMTSCKEGGELTVLCANNYLVQFVVTQNGFQQAKQIVLEEHFSSANVVSMHKLDQDLFGIFDTRGSLRFVSLEDPELVKFKTKYESTET